MTIPKPTQPPLESKWLDHVTKPARILFLDDDKNLRDLMAVVCSQYHVILVIAETIKEAIIIATEQGPFDAMILDVRLSNGTGLDFYAYVMSKWPRTHVVFLTGYSSPELCEKVERIGPARVHTKGNVMAQPFLTALFAQWGIPPVVGP